MQVYTFKSKELNNLPHLSEGVFQVAVNDHVILMILLIKKLTDLVAGGKTHDNKKKLL